MDGEMTKPKTVELVKTAYQPTRRELDKPIVTTVPGDTVEERMANIGKALTQPVKIRWIDKPRDRR